MDNKRASKRESDQNDSYAKHAKIAAEPSEASSQVEDFSHLPLCRYGSSCYRRNRDHLLTYRHPHLEKIIKDNSDVSSTGSNVDVDTIRHQIQILKESMRASTPEDVEVEQKANSAIDNNKNGRYKTVMEKLKAAHPYNFFLTMVKDSEDTYSETLSLRFPELLDPSLGKLKSSLQINFMVEMEWMWGHYLRTGNGDKPLLILYGMEDGTLRNKSNLPPTVTAIHVKPPYPYGQHHTKMCIFAYEDGSVRIVIHTANLIGDDWFNRTQGLWVSPLCPPLDGESSCTIGDSDTKFKSELIRYLYFYKIPQVKEWIDRVKAVDCSHINVCFVASVPASHKGMDLKKYGHRRLATLLAEYVPSTVKTWPIVVQCSSIGSLGEDPNSWVKSDLGSSLSSCGSTERPSRSADVKVIFPSHKNVMNSHDGILGGGCLPYTRKGHENQVWLKTLLHQWTSSKRFRSRAMPHIKTYGRMSLDLSCLAWFVLTSANLSKAAWGKGNKNGSSHFIQSYEAGVLFLPKYIVNSDYFELTGNNKFPLPYDIPLTAYEGSDEPWFIDNLRV